MDRLLLARRTWESDRQQACNEAAKALNVDPSGALGKLESFAGGCDWLIAEWQKVANGLERQVGLNDREVERALQLLAVSQATTVSSRSGQAEFWRCHLALVGSADLGALRRFEKAEPPNGRTNVLARQAEARRRLPSPEQAQGRMRAIVHAEIDRLKALRPQRWADSDLPHRQHAEDLVQFDDSDHATGMKRYESSSSLEVHRCLNQLAKRQRQAEPKQRSNSRARASSQ
ncbi:MAG TPA: hypothetical protein VGZ22_15895, partial [Isosphaeraceae bacterium]|nr:hypothetical protein [Isosphaeraceae bacterium]